MLTASWFTWNGPGRVGISLGVPRGTSAGYRIFKALAPSRDMLRIEDQAEYRQRYFDEILLPLDPVETYDQLRRLAGGDYPPVLLCWERPPWTDSNWCHRRMAAEWFQEHLGFEVPEAKSSWPAKMQAKIGQGTLL